MDVINVVHLFTFYSAIWENEGSTAKGKCAYFGTSVPESHPTSRDTADCEGLVHSTRRPFLNHKTQLEKRFGRHFDLCFSFLDQLKLSNILDVDETCFFCISLIIMGPSFCTAGWKKKPISLSDFFQVESFKWIFSSEKGIESSRSDSFCSSKHASEKTHGWLYQALWI